MTMSGVCRCHDLRHCTALLMSKQGGCGTPVTGLHRTLPLSLVPHLVLPAATLPLDLLTSVLQTACAHLNTPAQHQHLLAQLVRLASVCRHWQTAAGTVASQLTSLRLPCHSLTPALKPWAGHWTCLDMTLDKRGAPPGLQALMRDTSTLTEVILRSMDPPGPGHVQAVHQALAVAPAVQNLQCVHMRPAAFPRSLVHLSFDRHIQWAKHDLEALLMALQQLPCLQSISVELGFADVILSEERLSNLSLPSLQTLKLSMYTHKSFDLSWLRRKDRAFALVFALDSIRSGDELLGAMQAMRSVLRPTDSLQIYCECMDQPTSQVLSELVLKHFHLRIDNTSPMLAVPAAEHIEIEFVVSSDEVEDELAGPDQGHICFKSSLPWAALTSARVSFKATLDCADIYEVNSEEWVECCRQLHVLDAPVGPAANPWWQSLAQPDRAWSASLSGWEKVTGMPPAVSRTRDKSGTKTYELRHAGCSE